MSVRKRQFSPDRTDYGRCFPARRRGVLRFAACRGRVDGFRAKQRMRLT
ncbi:MULTISPECIES: hypothetical protein [Paenibacillus]|nr:MULTISPECIES: hypothetical protein [Paenibacillus]MCM2997489.1 hypothetical protein [Paenibacillus cellulositrophicus]UYO03520.1 hypothetical protein K2F33_28250 [Paenibacillus sp. PSB04]